MTTEDADFARKIAAHLDQGTADLKAGTAYRLQQARGAALARLSGAHAAAPALAGARTLAGLPGHGTRGRSRWSSGSESKETDAALLSSDLPIDAYLDRGFQNWIKTSDN
jgi:hypothetical protein